jgi:hypothetical protein
MLILGKNGRKDMVVAGQKNGFVWALDPDNGASPSLLRVMAVYLSKLMS